jgi:hypothetical protein
LWYLLVLRIGGGGNGGAPSLIFKDYVLMCSLYGASRLYLDGYPCGVDICDCATGRLERPWVFICTWSPTANTGLSRVVRLVRCVLLCQDAPIVLSVTAVGASAMN